MRPYYTIRDKVMTVHELWLGDCVDVTYSADGVTDPTIYSVVVNRRYYSGSRQIVACREMNP